jgi:long-chain fatty acid transport protein
MRSDTLRALAISASMGGARGPAPRAARASNVTEIPDNGSEQMARGGAWLARASDPLATMFNPAGLAGQPTRVTIQNSLIFEHTCFTRVRAMGDTTNDPLAAPGGAFPRVCNDVAPSVNPQIGVTLRLTDRLGLGLLVIGPSAAGDKTFPDFVNDANGQPQAAPNRYLLVQQSGIIVFPTVGLGYEIIDNLRVGASFSWGISRLKLTTATLSLNADNTTPAGNDTRATLQVHDYFVPAFNLGALWSATPELDVAGWYKWSDAIRARGDVGTAAGYYQRENALGNDRNVRYGDTIYQDCGTGLPTTACAGGQNATLKLVIPMEAKVGVRYHKPRAMKTRYEGAATPEQEEEERAAFRAAQRTRDPLATDVFDVEADFTWANNSAADVIQVRFPGDATGKGSLPVAGVAGGEIPPNADQRRGFKDVVGVRVGGDYNVLPDQLALRGGAFFETSAADPALQALDFVGSTRFGLALGGTYRVRFGEGEKTSALEIMAGYSHVFFAEQSRTDPNASGAPGIAGTSCDAGTPKSPSECVDGSARYRTKWPVNLGTITNSVNVINVGLAYRF